MHDLIVIGGGPAGTAAAITAARNGARVLLLERGKFPRHKVCGEFVSAESLVLLANLLNQQDAGVLRDAVRITNARIFLDGRILQTKVDPAAASIARIDLDSALWQAAMEAGVDSYQQVAVQVVTGKGRFSVNTTNGEFEGRTIINASGRWSNLTAGEKVQSKGQARWIGLKAHFAEASTANSTDLYFFGGGYCGVQPVHLNDGSCEARVNACAMVRSDAATSLPEVLALHPDLRRRAASWQPVTAPVSTSPLCFREPQPVRDCVLMAGDAAAFVDPFVGDGISLALRSGTLAAECLIPFLAGNLGLAEAATGYRTAYQRQLAPVYRMSSRIRRLLNVSRGVRRPVVAMLERFPAVTRYLVNSTR